MESLHKLDVQWLQSERYTQTDTRFVNYSLEAGDTSCEFIYKNESKENATLALLYLLLFKACALQWVTSRGPKTPIHIAFSKETKKTKEPSCVTVSCGSSLVTTDCYVVLGLMRDAASL